MHENTNEAEIPPPIGPGRNTELPRPSRRAREVVAIDREEDRFDRLSTLGEGGMGIVELVRDNDIGRLVALKRLRSRSDARHALLFAREARCMGQLEHPGIVPVHDVGRSGDGTYYLVMKHLEGETLSAIIEKLKRGDSAAHERFPIHERERICEAVLRIIEYAHGRGVVHRDIKPDNVMIGEHGEVTIVDWGLAKRVGEAEGDDAVLDEFADDALGFGTQADGVLGTPLYMSPEQAAGGEVGTSSDVYSLAVVFYEFLSLEHYLGTPSNLAEILLGVADREAKLAYWATSPHQPRVPIELAYWLQKGLAKNPADRFPSVTAMREEFARVTDGRFDVVCPTTLSRRVFRAGMNSANRRPVLILVAMVLVAVLASYGAFRAVTDWT